MNYEVIGNFIKERRKIVGLTEKELADKIGVTDKAVSKWETGRGIPDISILEVLAKELNSSIIEILKGESIENGEIKKSDVDSYIKESINYSKSKYKDTINKVLSFLIIFIVLLVFSLNIINIYNQHKKYYPGDNVIAYEDYNNSMNEDIDTINNLISKIRSDKGKYIDTNYERLIKTIDNIEDSLKEDKFLTYNGEGYTLNEIYLNEYDLKYGSSIYSLAAVMIDIDEKYRDLFYSTAFNYINSQNQESYYSIYKYEFYKPLVVRIHSRQYPNIIASKLNEKLGYIKMLKYLLNEVVEVGDINE